MRTQLVPAARLHRITLVAVVTLLASALVVATDCRRIIIVNSGTSESVLGVTGSKRQLRARKHQGDEFPENRGLNFNKVPGVANVLQKLSKNPANELEAEQLFLKLNLANAKSTLFENPQFQAWSARVVKGHQTKPEAAQTAIAATLTKQLGDEALAKMIAAAKEVEGTKSMAAQLEQAQLKSNERNANYVFQVLKLHKETCSLLWNPLLNTWASYAKMLKADPPMLLFDKMKAHYSDATIANLLASAKRENAAPFIVDDVENLLFDTWMAKDRLGTRFSRFWD
uniref:Avh345 n=1 Tax=Phytophthora sojae TaxID=67593 RepID=G1FSX7_PHYSO|nr:Avh345 [Phytophthora sojae]